MLAIPSAYLCLSKVNNNNKHCLIDSVAQNITAPYNATLLWIKGQFLIIYHATTYIKLRLLLIIHCRASQAAIRLFLMGFVRLPNVGNLRYRPRYYIKVRRKVLS